MLLGEIFWETLVVIFSEFTIFQKVFFFQKQSLMCRTSVINAWKFDNTQENELVMRTSFFIFIHWKQRNTTITSFEIKKKLIFLRNSSLLNLFKKECFQLYFWGRILFQIWSKFSIWNIKVVFLAITLHKNQFI